MRKEIQALVFNASGPALWNRILRKSTIEETSAADKKETAVEPELNMLDTYLVELDQPVSRTAVIYACQQERQEAADRAAGFKHLDIPLSHDLQRYIFQLSQEYGVDYYMVLAVIKHESSFRADAISATNDYGLMQLNVRGHEYLSNKLGITDFLDPYQNVLGGIYMLGDLSSKYSSLSKVLMAYNMGEGRAADKWSEGIYQTGYSREVLRLRDEYAAA